LFLSAPRFFLLAPPSFSSTVSPTVAIVHPVPAGGRFPWAFFPLFFLWLCASPPPQKYFLGCYLQRGFSPRPWAPLGLCPWCMFQGSLVFRKGARFSVHVGFYLLTRFVFLCFFLPGRPQNSNHNLATVLPELPILFPPRFLTSKLTFLVFPERPETDFLRLDFSFPSPSFFFFLFFVPKSGPPVLGMLVCTREVVLLFSAFICSLLLCSLSFPINPWPALLA